jgi:hypothetical protein
MRNLIRMVALLAVLDSRETIAQTIGHAGSSAGSARAVAPSTLAQNTRLIDAPVGHRQPHARDVSWENTGDLAHIGEEDAAIDRKLNRCRGADPSC